jgi:hypothetical protein
MSVTVAVAISDPYGTVNIGPENAGITNTGVANTGVANTGVANVGDGKSERQVQD